MSVKIKITKPDDRDTVCVILCRNGYTVRQGKGKDTSGKTYSYVEVIELGNDE